MTLEIPRNDDASKRDRSWRDVLLEQTIAIVTDIHWKYCLPCISATLEESIPSRCFLPSIPNLPHIRCT